GADVRRVESRVVELEERGGGLGGPGTDDQPGGDPAQPAAPALRPHRARMAFASAMSLARRTSLCGLVARRWRSAASRCAPRMRPPLATKPAASSRAWSTTLSLPEVEPEVAPVDAEEPPAAEPAV